MLTPTARIVVAFLLLVAPNEAFGEKRPPTLERLVNDLSQVARPTLSSYSASERYGLSWALRYRRPRRAGKRDRLQRVFKSLLQARLGDFAGFRPLQEVAAPPGATRGDLREGARATGTDLLLVVDVFVAHNHLHAVGELHEVRASFWARIRRPVAGMRSHFYASARMDAELRALMDEDTARGRRIFELTPAPAQLSAGLGEILAAGTGDVDDDGFNELAVLGRGGLRIARIAPDGSVQVLATRSLDGLPRPKARPRGTYGAIQLADVDADGRAEVALWTSDLRHGHIFTMRDGALVPSRWPAAIVGSACGRKAPLGAPVTLCGAALGWFPPLDVGRSARPRLLISRPVSGRNHYEARLGHWSIRGEESHHPHPGLYWNLAAHALKRRAPGQYTDLVGTVGRHGQLDVRGGGSHWRLQRAGTALAITDLNDDGEAELLRAGDGLPGTRDTLYVHRLASRGRLPTVFKAGSAPIVALSAGDVDNDGRIEALVVTPRRIVLLEERRKGLRR